MRSDRFENVSISSKFWQTNFCFNFVKTEISNNFRAKRLHLSGKLLNEPFALKTLKIVWGSLHT